MILPIDSPFIRLDQLLKLAAIADTGGMAKFLIQEGFVTHNGEVCTARGKKIYPGDVVDVRIAEENIEERIEVVFEKNHENTNF